MTRITTFTILTLLSSGVQGQSSDCIVPTSDSTQCTTCPPAAIQNGQCTAGGRWVTCQSSVETCCSSPPVSSTVPADQCINEYKWQTDPPCDHFASNRPNFLNTECIAECQRLKTQGVTNPEVNADFSANCHNEYYRIINNRVNTAGNCFDNWVYGNSNPADISGYKIVENVPNPNECQILCQQEPECVRWTWASPLAGDATDKPFRCSLKNEEEVRGALNVQYLDNGTTLNQKNEFCQVALEPNCRSGFYKCDKCEGVMRCLWDSTAHVNGWKWCPLGDRCSPPDWIDVQTTTSTSTTTTTSTTSLTDPPTTTTITTTQSTTPTTTTPTTTPPITVSSTPTTRPPTTTPPTTPPTTTPPTTTPPTTTPPTTTVPPTTTTEECRCPVDDSCLVVEGAQSRGLEETEVAFDYNADNIVDATQGLVLTANKLVAENLNLDTRLLTHVWGMHGVRQVPPTIVMNNTSAFVPPTIVMSDGKALTAPQFELAGERFVAPLVFVGASSMPTYVIRNQTVAPVRYNIVANNETPVVVQIDNARYSNIPLTVIIN